MNESSELWAKLHGAATHFPVALAICSVACDAAGLALSPRALGIELRRVGHWTWLGAALATVPAVLSGLMMTRGVVLGSDALRWHHLFVWPAFGLLVGLAVWRVLQRVAASTWAVGLALMAAGLMTAAAYWGGEMMLAPAP